MQENSHMYLIVEERVCDIFLRLQWVFSWLICIDCHVPSFSKIPEIDATETIAPFLSDLAQALTFERWIKQVRPHEYRDI